MKVWFKLTMDDFLWLLGSLVASCDIVFDWCAMLSGLLIKRFFHERWPSFSLVVWLRSISRYTSWCVILGSGLSTLEVWKVASVLQGGFCVVIGCWGKLFGCFEGNFDNTGRMEMFSLPGESDLVESFMFGQGRIQIPSLTCLFDSVIWNEWSTVVS